MTDIFLYGSLLHAPLFRAVAGRPLETLAPCRARWPGHGVFWAAAGGRRQAFPIAAADPAPDSGAEGLLLRDVEDAVLARLDFYESCFDYGTREITLATQGQGGEPGGPCHARIYLPEADRWQAGAPWSLGEWERQWGPLSVAAAAEVMSRYGLEPPAAVGRRFARIRSRAQARLRAGGEAPVPYSKGAPRSEVAVEADEIGYDGYFQLRRLRLTHPGFDGAPVGPVEREAFIGFDAVTVLPYDPVADRILLIEQFRVAPFARGGQWPWSVEAIAGHIDPGETAEEAALREAREEAGLQLLGLQRIGDYYPSTGAHSEFVTSFLGFADLADLPEGAERFGGVAGEAEDIRAFTLSWQEARAMLDDRQLRNAPLLISLQWLAARRERFRAEHGARA